MASLLYHAQQYLKHGFSVLRTDGRKAPVGKWKRLSSAALTEVEAAGYFGHPEAKGLGVICGRVSGNLEVIDVDTKHALHPATLLRELLDAISALDAALVAKLVIVETPSGGNHIYYRCPEATIPGSRKLAVRHSTPEELARSPHEKLHCYIETRGEGGYVAAMPSAGYTVRQGRMGAVPVISAQERETILAAIAEGDIQKGGAEHSKAQNPNLKSEISNSKGGKETELYREKEQTHPYKDGPRADHPHGQNPKSAPTAEITTGGQKRSGPGAANDGLPLREDDKRMPQHSNSPAISNHFQPSSNDLPTTFERSHVPTLQRPYPATPSPIDDYNQRGDVVALLIRHGWTVVGQQGEKVVMKRPGTTDSISSGDYHRGMRLFTVFSTSTEFKAVKGYKPAGVYALLECGGDFKAAARKLRAEGYGGKKEEGKRKKEEGNAGSAAGSDGVETCPRPDAGPSSCRQAMGDQKRGTRNGHPYGSDARDDHQQPGADTSQPKIGTPTARQKDSTRANDYPPLRRDNDQEWADMQASPYGGNAGTPKHSDNPTGQHSNAPTFQQPDAPTFQRSNDQQSNNFQLPPATSATPIQFWRVNPMTQKPVLVLTALERLLSQAGGYGLWFHGESGNNYMLVRREGGVVDEVATEHIKKYVKRYVESLPAVIEGTDGAVRREDLLEAVYRSKVFSDDLYEYLPRLQIDFLKDTKERAYYPFRNGVVEVSAEGVMMRRFDDLVMGGSGDLMMGGFDDLMMGGSGDLMMGGFDDLMMRAKAPEDADLTLQQPSDSPDRRNHHQIIKSSHHQIIKSPHHQITKSPNHQIKLPAVWRSAIIQHDIAMPDEEMKAEEIDFFRFLKMVCDDDGERLAYAMRVIGYLLHGYKDPVRSYCIVLAEETDDERTGGGTGKGIFFKALGKLVPQLVMDGKNLRLDKNFAFQRVQPDHRLVVIDDVRSKVDFEGFYSMITEGFTIEKKNKDEVYIPYKDAPKIIFSTNYAIPAAANHAKRRQRVVEFGKRFNAECTPLDVFGHRLFEDWDDAEWGRFYNFLFACVQKYLKEGIGERETSAVSKRKQVRLLYGEEFMEWWEEYSGEGSDGKTKYLNELYDGFLSDNGFEKKDYSNMRFKKAMKESALLYGYELKERKNSSAGGKKEIRLVKCGTI